MTRNSTAGSQRCPLGDSVAADEVIAQIETDKVTMDVRAPAAGVINEIKARLGCEQERPSVSDISLRCPRARP